MVLRIFKIIAPVVFLTARVHQIRSQPGLCRGPRRGSLQGSLRSRSRGKERDNGTEKWKERKVAERERPPPPFANFWICPCVCMIVIIIIIIFFCAEILAPLVESCPSGPLVYTSRDGGPVLVARPQMSFRSAMSPSAGPLPASCSHFVDGRPQWLDGGHHAVTCFARDPLFGDRAATAKCVFTVLVKGAAICRTDIVTAIVIGPQSTKNTMWQSHTADRTVRLQRN